MEPTDVFKQKRSLSQFYHENKNIDRVELLNDIKILKHIRTQEVNTKNFLSKYRLFEEMYNSNKIEGSTLDRYDTKLLIEESLMPESHSLKSALEVLNLDDAMRKFNIIDEVDKELLLEIHRTITHRVISPHDSGSYRQCPVHIDGVQLITSPWQEVDYKMSCIIDKYNDSDKSIIDIFRFKYDLVTIHPFVDGNGRTSRLIMNAMLSNKGYPRLIIEDKEKKLYYKALDKSQQKYNPEYFINYCLILMKYTLENLRGDNIDL